jgi:hypothetical protein
MKEEKDVFQAYIGYSHIFEVAVNEATEHADDDAARMLKDGWRVESFTVNTVVSNDGDHSIPYLMYVITVHYVPV